MKQNLAADGADTVCRVIQEHTFLTSAISMHWFCFVCIDSNNKCRDLYVRCHVK